MIILTLFFLIIFNQNVLATNQCALNCRAIGYRFYATLKPMVIDGTSCNGTNDSGPYVCVEGQCKVSENSHSLFSDVLSYLYLFDKYLF